MDAASLADVWRTEDRLHSDEATTRKLCDIAKADDAIAAVIRDIEPDVPGNGSVWARATAVVDESPVYLKLGARSTEREWMVAIDAATDDVVPRIFAAGVMHGVGWLVLERCEPDFDRETDDCVAAVVATAARWQHAGTKIQAATETMDVEWVRRQLVAAGAQACPGDVDRALDDLDTGWNVVTNDCGVTPNHGDVHLQNVVGRTGADARLLIDPMPITTVWPWDAAYLQVVTARQTGLVLQLAQARAALGLPTADDLERVERLVLGWAAAYWWRIAPWRHDNSDWRQQVERYIDDLYW